MNSPRCVVPVLCVVIMWLPVVRFASGQTNLEQARAKIAALEAQMHREHPELRAVQAEYERLKAEYARQPSRGADVGDYLTKEDGDSLSKPAHQQYNELKSRWVSVRLVERMKDPKTEPLVKAVSLASPQRIEQISKELVKANPSITAERLRDPEVFWSEYKSLMLRMEPKIRQEVKDFLNVRSFPAYVAAEAKLAAFSKFDLDFVYFPYIEIATPESLRRARAEETRRLQAGAK